MIIPALSHRQQIAFWTGVLAFVALCAGAVFRYVSPSPPRSLTMSTGTPDGAYHQFALRYQQLLKAQGVALELRPSSGAVENLQRLNEHTADVALVQGGLGFLALDAQPDADDTPLRSLATVFYEPVWIFSHTLDLSRGLGALAGRKIAIGVPGSGNARLALDLLAVYGVADARGRPAAGTTLAETGGMDAARQLQAHALDAVILVAAPQAPAVRLLLEDSAIRLASLDHVEGLARRFPYFQPVSLKRGSVDPRRDLPSRDIALLATTANLVVRDDLHPALAYLLLDAAHQTHRQPGLLSRPDDFPSPRATDFPLSDEADRYFKTGRPFLQRYLPFWAANFVQRLVLLLVPLIAVLVPLFKILPPLLTWKQKNRLFRRYGELKFLEKDLAARTLTAAERQAAHARLDRIEHEAGSAKFPLDFADRVYTLRQHVDYVRGQLDKQSPS
jgi:TRAP transporter TAXI family solute receptor